jgi:SAM-dependent methyltransferase
VGHLYDRIGVGYTETRREDPAIAAVIHAALGDARTVVNVGAGAGSYEPRDRDVLAVEPSPVMRAQRPPGAAPAIQASADALPFADGEFDAVLCECSLSTFPDKERAVAEMRRVLRPGGRAAISDVVADPARLPEPLGGTIATLACVGGALPLAAYERLLAERRLRKFAVESLDDQAAQLAQRLEDRLRAGRLLERCRASEWCPFGFDEAIGAVRLARRAIDDGALGYAILAATAH